MLIAVIIVGTAVLVGLALVIGLVEGGSLRVAWTRVATERRALAQWRQELAAQAEFLAAECRRLRDWERQLNAVAPCDRCPARDLYRKRGDGSDP